MLAEQQTEWIINNNLINKGWYIDNNHHLKNVYFQKPKLEEQRKKLKGKKPDYILYQSGTDKPIAIIEAKKGGVDLEPALNQAIEYAKDLDVSLVFAMNGTYCKTRFIPTDKELVLNGEEVRELIKEVEVLKFLEENTNEIYTLPKQVIVSRSELIKIFKDLNDTLRAEGLRAGIERFSEFANILFLKLLSENETESYWDFIKKLPDNRLITTINNSIIKEIENKYGGNVFTSISIQNPTTLRKIIDRIDPLVLSTIDTDIKGDAFEYFLRQTTSTNNDLGEYFTPRHIIKTVVNLVAPKFKEKVYDPFCGTGGFLTETFNYIKENNIIEDKSDLKRLKQDTLYGGEITTTARIAKMNMILHGDGHSGVQQIDSLANPIDHKYDIVITNIPFSQATNFGSLYYNNLSKNGDSTCVLHCLRALKEGGRMALVVPEGFLFKSDSKLIREFLLTKATLQTIISLPSGSFLPYTGVKTNILYFTNVHKTNNQKNYWYFNVKNDGYSLDNHRKRLQGKSDIQKVEESDFKKIEKDETLKDNLLEIGFEIIDLGKVKKNNYDLRLNQYVERNYNIDTISLKKLVVLKKGKNPKSFSTTIENSLPYLNIDFFEDKNVKYVFSLDKMICSDKNNILIVADGQRSGLVFLGKTKGVVASTFYLVCNKNKKIIDDLYLYSFIKSNFKYLNDNKYGSAIPHLDKKLFLDLQIPIIPMEDQLKFRDRQRMIEQKKQQILDIQKQIDDDINYIWQSN